MSTPWQPILTGAQLAAADGLIGELLERVLKDAARTDLPPGLSIGKAGLALALAETARARRSSVLAERAEQVLVEAMESISNGALELSLFGGLCGVGWAIEQLRAMGPTELEGSEDLDELVATAIERWSGTFDLVSGVSGIAVYALTRSAPAAERARGAAVHWLERSARNDEAGAFWVKPGMDGRDLGVARGLPGVINVLARLDSAGSGNARGLVNFGHK